MADFSEVTESECIKAKMPDGCEVNASRTFVLQSVINEIKAHGRTSMHQEVCGVLLGNLCFDGRAYLLVDARIEGKFATHQSGSVTFTSETWDYINNERDSKYPEKKIVGWYHTHPGFGIFLSNMDAFIHNNFFSLKWQPAYVFDPQAETDGFFFAKDGSLNQEDVVVVPDVTAQVVDSKFKASAEKIVVLTEEEESKQATRRFTTLILSAALLIIVIANLFGYFIVRDKLVSSQKVVEDSAKNIRTLENETKRISGENVKLRDDGRKLNARIQVASEELRNAMNRVREQKDANATLIKNYKSLESLLSEAKAQCARRQKVIVEKENEIRELTSRTVAKEAEVQALRGQIADIDAHAKELEGEIGRLREALDRANQREKEKTVTQNDLERSEHAWYEWIIFWR